MRTLPLIVLLGSCSLFGPTEESRQLALYQQNAQTYWESGNLARTLDQVRRGLEIDPDNYKLLTLRGWVLLRRSTDQPELLEPAARQFEDLLEMRSEDEQAPQVRLGFAKVHGKLGVELLQRANRLEERAERDPSRTDAAAEAAEARAEANRHFQRAEEQLERLVERGESLLLAHYDLMSLKWWRGDYEGAVEHGNAYLERVAEVQDPLREDLERTLEPAYEQFVRQELQRIVDDEIEVRAFLANMHFKRGHHELAVEQLDEVLRLDPHRYNDYYNRGVSLMALGREEDGRKDLEKFLATTRLPAESAQVKDALRILREGT